MSLTSLRIAELLPPRCGVIDSDEFADTAFLFDTIWQHCNW